MIRLTKHKQKSYLVTNTVYRRLLIFCISMKHGISKRRRLMCKKMCIRKLLEPDINIIIMKTVTSY